MEYFLYACIKLMHFLGNIYIDTHFNAKRAYKDNLS